MNFAADSVQNLIVTVGAFVVLCGITAVFFLYGERLVSFLGQSGLNVITRLMGLILAVIGVQMAIDGVRRYDDGAGACVVVVAGEGMWQIGLSV